VFDHHCLRMLLLPASVLQTRKYFIAAVPEVWDCVPFGGEMCTI
jgi:hypothetical protein